MNSHVSPADATDTRILRDRHAEMLAAYGFGLPLPLPELHTTRAGEWSITERSGGTWPAYLSKRSATPDHHVLRGQGTTWAATGLRDLESFAWHIEKAKGDVVVVGTGLGTYLHAIAAKSSVNRIIAVDMSAEALLVLRVSAMPHNWDGYEKISFVQADPFSAAGSELILSHLNGQRPDYLLVDLAPLPADPESAKDTHDLVALLHPHCAGWRGQEVEVARWSEGKHRVVDTRMIDAYFSSVGVPMHSTEAYVEFCVDVGRAHGLDVTADVMAVS